MHSTAGCASFARSSLESSAPEVLAAHRDVRCAASEATLRAALTGHYRAEHVFALRQALELYEVHQRKITECDVEIETTLRTLNETRTLLTAHLPAKLSIVIEEFERREETTDDAGPCRPRPARSSTTTLRP